jgi:hypothetical protein
MMNNDLIKSHDLLIIFEIIIVYMNIYSLKTLFDKIMLIIDFVQLIYFLFMCDFYARNIHNTFL